ncbi:MAG: AmmeMemoRadiSam system radical SAM enzyme [Clostridiales bacterium]|nr:AmmeMemoRadiSam system radical SAM enzyme [Clostridiales bacterium]
MKEAYFYKSIEESVICILCPHKCLIKENETGICAVRKNIDGKLYSMNYGRLSSINLDPIEKKPLMKFLQNSRTLSVGSFGCNLSCLFCQNYRIAKETPLTVYRTPEDIVNLAREYDIPSISFTYNEPIVSYEFVLDTAILAKEKGIKCILVTNGYIEASPLLHLIQYIDAMNIDLKTFSCDEYKKNCNGEVEPVKRTIKIANKFSHIEVTTLLVTGMNDKEEALLELFNWLAEADKNIPLHLTRYFPSYKYDKPATGIAFARKVKRMAEDILSHVYLGNVR